MNVLSFQIPFLRKAESQSLRMTLPATQAQQVSDVPCLGDGNFLQRLSDAELQTYIHQRAELFYQAHLRWERHGNFADVGDRDRYYHEEAAALVERGIRGASV